jgi:hypothetical protein
MEEEAKIDDSTVPSVGQEDAMKDLSQRLG